MLTLAIIPWFALCNRARGSRLYGFTTSTELGRIVSMMGMAWVASLLAVPDAMKMLEVFAWSFAALMLWCSEYWDKFWSEEIGHSLTHSRLYGLMQMTLRMGLIIPYLLGFGLITDSQHLQYMAGAIFLGLPYYILGYTKTNYAVPFSEYIVGGIIGALTVLIA